MANNAKHFSKDLCKFSERFVNPKEEITKFEWPFAAKAYVTVGGAMAPRLVEKRKIAELSSYGTLTSSIKFQSFHSVHIRFIWNPDRAMHFTIAPSYHRLVGRWCDGAMAR